MVRSKGIEKSFSFSDRVLPYRLVVSSRARHIRLLVTREGVCFLTVPYGTREHVISQVITEKGPWILEKMEYFSARIMKNPLTKLGTGGRREYLTHKEHTRSLIEKKLHHFNQFYSVKWKRISIKNMTSRWGSCSKLGNLNFSYKVALLPEELLDYIVVHEMCHLLELNHSASFWRQVARSIPDYLSKRRALRKYT
jgi:predicted metal-dependent hydrolase